MVKAPPAPIEPIRVKQSISANAVITVATRKKRVPLHPKTFFHSGDLGDVLFSLPAMRALGGGTLMLGPDSGRFDIREQMGLARASILIPLLNIQPYVVQAIHSPIYPKVDYDLNDFRKVMAKTPLENLATASLKAFGLPAAEAEKPWITVDNPIKVSGKSVILCKTGRYPGGFDWSKILQQYGKEALLVGTKAEHESFVSNYGPVDFFPTDNFLELARLIAGSELFISNQCGPHALAEGMKHRLIQEPCPECPVAMFERPGASYEFGNGDLGKHLIVNGFAKKKQVLVIKRTAAIGDTIAVTPIAKQLSERGYDVTFQSNGNFHKILSRCVGVNNVVAPDGSHNVDLDGCYEKDPDSNKKHVMEMYVASASTQLGSIGIDPLSPRNCKPVIIVDADETQAFADTLRFERPWIFIVPRSNSFVNRQVPDWIWAQAVKSFKGTTFWAGTTPAPAGIHDLDLESIDQLPVTLSCADMVVTVDTGPMHVAAALGIPLVVLGQNVDPQLRLSDQRDYTTLWPDGLECLNCHNPICPKNPIRPPCQLFNPESIADAVNQKLDSINGFSISALVPIWKPPVERLNRCLMSLVGQVDEIVVTGDADSVKPTGALVHPKIRYVRGRCGSVGFGRNVNFGFRQTNGSKVLLVNDDVVLASDAVQNLRAAAMKPGVGMVGNLLFFPDGTIQHGGKYRKPGEQEWLHYDVRASWPTIKSVTEMENVTGASVLVDRKAFYKAGGFDEDFYMYGEDDAFCLAIRQQGYKVVYTPFAMGIHEEGATTRAIANPQELSNAAKAIFLRKWGWWLAKNSQTIPGTF